jgi:predicted secreted protein
VLLAYRLFLGITDEDLDEPIYEILNEVLPQNMSILIVDQGVLCGVIINSISNIDRTHVKEPKIKEDYGAGIFHKKYVNFIVV